MSMKPNFTAHPVQRAGAPRAAGEESPPTPAEAGGKAPAPGPTAPEATDRTDKLELR